MKAYPGQKPILPHVLRHCALCGEDTDHKSYALLPVCKRHRENPGELAKQVRESLTQSRADAARFLQALSLIASMRDPSECQPFAQRVIGGAEAQEFRDLWARMAEVVKAAAEAVETEHVTISLRLAVGRFRQIVP